MQIKYYNSNINNIKNTSSLDKEILDTILKLPSLNIIHDKNLLNYTTNITKQFELNKKKIIVFGTGGSNLGARALYNIVINIYICNLKKRKYA